MSDIQWVPVEKIVAGPNDRKEFNPVELQRLADAIASYGPENWPALPLYRPIAGGCLEIVAGERRTRAMRDLLGWSQIRAFVREMSDEEAAAIMLGENKNRVDLNPIEEAEGYQSRMVRYGWDARKIAEVAGETEDLVKRRVKLLSLAPDVQHFIKHGQLPIGHGQLLTPLDANRQRIALRIYNAGGMSLARFKDVVDELIQQQQQEAATPLFDLDAFMREKVAEVASQPDVKSGRLARPGAPTRRDLPVVRFRANDTTGEIMERYIADLLERGHLDEAAAVGNLYTTLVGHNWLRLPVAPLLAGTVFNQTAEEISHEAQIKG